jgi:hypothetical protein
VRTKLLVALSLVAACGGKTPPPAPSSAPSPSDTAPTAPASSASSGATSSLEAPYEDVAEGHDPTTLTPEFDKGARPTFPKGTTSESACWRTMSLTGDAQKDFDALVAKCGTATGAVEYAKPASGKLHSVKDKRDTYLLHIQGGLCYRFLGVGDGTIQDLDILILQAGGALVGDDKTTGPVAIIESDKAWCMDRDVDYQFLVEVDGQGTGHYVFGAWARPK